MQRLITRRQTPRAEADRPRIRRERGRFARFSFALQAVGQRLLAFRQLLGRPHIGRRPWRRGFDGATAGARRIGVHRPPRLIGATTPSRRGTARRGRGGCERRPSGKRDKNHKDTAAAQNVHFKLRAAKGNGGYDEVGGTGLCARCGPAWMRASALSISPAISKGAAASDCSIDLAIASRSSPEGRLST